MSLFEELKRRNVAKVAVLYAVASWLILQIADVCVSLLELPGWVGKAVFLILALGFPLVLIFSWAYEMTPEGLKRERDVDRDRSITSETGSRINVLIVVLLALAIAAVIVDRLVPETTPAADSATTDEGRQTVTVDSEPPATDKSPAAPDRSIAVLPFVNMSSDEEQEYFSDGLSEELLNLLSRIPQLRVAARTSSFAFKGQNVTVGEIGETLKVAHVLEGSVRKSGKHMRITVQLIHAEDGYHLWSETYDRDLEDVFAIQDEIAAEVVQQLKATLLGDAVKVEETDPEAYVLYLQGRYLSTQGTAESLLTAADLYRQALAIDPDYAPAWNGLSRVYNSLITVTVIPLDEGRRMFMETAQRALLADPDNAAAYANLGWGYRVYDGDLAASARYYQKALDLAPNDPDALSGAAALLAYMGRVEEAISVHQWLLERDPLNTTSLNNLADAYNIGNRIDEARTVLDKALALSPEFMIARYNSGVNYYRHGDYQQYLDDLTWLAEKSGNDGIRLMAQAIAYPKIGKAEEGKAALMTLERDNADGSVSGTYWIGVIYALYGQPDEAFQWLKKAAEFGSGGTISEARGEPFLASLHDDPRWQPFLATIGLSDDQVSAIEFNVTLPE